MREGKRTEMNRRKGWQAAWRVHATRKSVSVVL
jgi:hypothetical protein